MQQKFLPGQRWISDSEPELGLGTVLEASFRQVTLRFAAADETRIYRIPGAPLRRVRLQPGDRARATDPSSACSAWRNATGCWSTTAAARSSPRASCSTA